MSAKSCRTVVKALGACLRATVGRKDVNIISRNPSRRVVDFDAAYCSYENWFATFPKLRKESQVCWSEAHGGYWIVSTYDHVQRVARDWETFSSAKFYDPATGKAGRYSDSRYAHAAIYPGRNRSAGVETLPSHYESIPRSKDDR